ncbi:MAG: hypothetical protein ACQES9_10065 [Myxococcota bacterium]
MEKVFFAFILLWFQVNIAVAGDNSHENEPLEPRNKYERKIIKQGRSDIVYNLRKYNFKAKAFIRALKHAMLGINLYKQGDYGDSIFVFKRSWNIFPSPAILYWIAKSNLKFGKVVEAHKKFGDFLHQAKKWKVTTIKKDLLKDAKKQFEKLEKNLASLKLETNVKGAEIAVNGIILRDDSNKAIKTPLKKKIWLKPGYNRIVITKKGFVPHSIIIKKAEKGKVYSRKAKLLTPKELIIKSKLFKQAQLERRKIEKMKKATELKLQKERRANYRKIKKRQKRFRLGGYSAMALSGALLAGGVVLEIFSYRHHQKVESAAPGTQWAQLENDYEKYQNYSTLAKYHLLAGGVLALGGGILTYFGFRKIKLPGDEKTATEIAIIPEFSPDQGSIMFSLSF